MTDRQQTAILRLCLFTRDVMRDVAVEMLNNRKQRKTMKKAIIPAGQPGIFRPSFGQYPEPESNVLTWQARHADNAPYSLHRLGASVHNNPAVYAWQYAPAAPLVDDFEAWCEGWRVNEYNGMHSLGRYDWFPLRGRLNYNDETIDFFPTLLEAQRAAYAHFLESLNSER